MSVTTMGTVPAKPSTLRSLFLGALAVMSVGAMAVVPMACSSGGVGDPCTPEDEYDATFAGFKVAEENIESRSFQCQTRLCLVNHFQGRVSCPLGQGTPLNCIKDSDCAATLGSTAKCVQSETFAPECTTCDGTDPSCVPVGCPNGLTCDKVSQVCTCTTTNDQAISGVNFVCELSNPMDSMSPQVLHSYTCHIPGNCQTQGAGATQANEYTNSVKHTLEPKDCCVPGTDTPVAVDVCGQCTADSNRDANNAVYCSCRCCAPCCPACPNGQQGLCLPTTDDPTTPSCSTDQSTCGANCDPNFNYCTCPSGYNCTNIRSNVGLGDANLAGAYCTKNGTAFESANNCKNSFGPLSGDNTCQGVLPTGGVPVSSM
jgi:hypothetical protein